MLQPYTQTTYETCLACCLLQGVGRLTKKKFSKKEERATLKHSLDNSKNDFAGGHIDYISKKYKIKPLRIIEFKSLIRWVKKDKINNKAIIKEEKIGLSLINKYLKTTKPILYIDSYALTKDVHYPHFITILEKKGNNYLIYDTWDGKKKILPKTTISKGISLLRNTLKFSPQLIIIE